MLTSQSETEQTAAMADSSAEPIANRDTPIPVVSVTSPDTHFRPSSASGPRTPSSDNGSRHHLSATKLKDKLESIGDALGRSESPSRVSDRLFTM